MCVGQNLEEKDEPAVFGLCGWLLILLGSGLIDSSVVGASSHICNPRLKMTMSSYVDGFHSSRKPSQFAKYFIIVGLFFGVSVFT